MGFGERLQREREMRGIALDDIATATKIGTRSLRALEQEEFDKLPGGIFNKGFVRAYARYLGMDEEQVVADYLAAVGEPAHKDPLDAEQLKKLEENWKATRTGISASDLRLPWRRLITWLVVIVVLVAAWHYRSVPGVRYQRWKQRRQAKTQVLPPAAAPVATTPVLPPQPVPAPAPAAQVVPPQPQPAPVPAAQKSVKPATPAVQPAAKTEAVSADAPAEDEFVVQVRARQDCWVEIIADGKVVMQGLLAAHGERTVRARDKITLTAGNAGGVDVFYNGQRQLLSAGEGKVRTITFTYDGLEP